MERPKLQLSTGQGSKPAAQGVHRDVKGDNVLVRMTDGRAWLVDFGSASYRSAARLTSQVFPPGTPLQQRATSA